MLHIFFFSPSHASDGSYIRSNSSEQRVLWRPCCRPCVCILNSPKAKLMVNTRHGHLKYIVLLRDKQAKNRRDRCRKITSPCERPGNDAGTLHGNRGAWAAEANTICAHIILNQERQQSEKKTCRSTCSIYMYCTKVRAYFHHEKSSCTPWHPHVGGLHTGRPSCAPTRALFRDNYACVCTNNGKCQSHRRLCTPYCTNDGPSCRGTSLMRDLRPKRDDRCLAQRHTSKGGVFATAVLQPAITNRPC